MRLFWILITIFGMLLTSCNKKNFKGISFLETSSKSYLKVENIKKINEKIYLEITNAEDEKYSRIFEDSALTAYSSVEGFFKQPFVTQIKIKIFSSRKDFDTFFASSGLWEKDVTSESWRRIASYSNIVGVISPSARNSDGSSDIWNPDVRTVTELFTYEFTSVFISGRTQHPIDGKMQETGWITSGLGYVILKGGDFKKVSCDQMKTIGSGFPKTLIKMASDLKNPNPKIEPTLQSACLLKYIDETSDSGTFMEIIEDTSNESVLKTLKIEEKSLMDGWKNWIMGDSEKSTSKTS
ncbi:MAG: hypothetical protein HQK54_03060 [Oligoflexales bacterium]|nr:hypothetical protein [Oligoflexales bacterium]